MEALYAKYEKQVCGSRVIPKTMVIELTMKKSVDLTQITYECFQTRGINVPINRAYVSTREFMLVTIRDFPMLEPEEITPILNEKMSKYGVVAETRLTFQAGREWLQPVAYILYDKEKSPGLEARLPSFLSFEDVGGTKASLHWRSAPKACKYCKQTGHLTKECPKLARIGAKRRRQEPVHSTNTTQQPVTEIQLDEPKSISSSPEGDASSSQANHIADMTDTRTPETETTH